VPRELLDYMTSHKDSLYPEFRKAWEAAGAKTSGTWEEVFGKAAYTDEIFMAWNYARYVGPGGGRGQGRIPGTHVREHLVLHGGPATGTYPSGGPLPHVADLWKVGAPAIDFRSPDLHSLNFSDWVDWYHPTPDFPLFIPEAFSRHRPLQHLLRHGQHDGIGFSPFAIDELLFTLEPGMTEELERRFSPNSVDELLFTGPFRTRIELVDLPLARSYDTIAQLTPLILRKSRKGHDGRRSGDRGANRRRRSRWATTYLTVSYVSSHVDPRAGPERRTRATPAAIPDPGPRRCALHRRGNR